MPIRRISLSLLALISATLPAGAAPPAPAVVFEAQAVIVTGGTPKGQVVLFGVARETGRTYLEMMVARPNQGAWALTLGDGGSSDADGRTVAALSSMRASGDSPGAPGLFSAHDVVSVVDPNRMEYYVEAVDAP